jgi:ankyrin repeat protein
MKHHYSIAVNNFIFLKHPQHSFSLLVRVQNEDLLKSYIVNKININAHHLETFTSPLMLAASLGYNHICKILLDAGAHVNATDLEGNTPLHLAIQHRNVVQTLLAYGADVNALNDDGYTPIMLIQHRRRT